MKRQKLFIVIFFMGALYSAKSYSQDMRFGVKAGLNLANISGEYGDDKPSMLTGFHIGGVADIGLSDQFSIIPEVLYSLKGAKQDYEESETTAGITTTNKYKTTAKYSYIEIPIMATYKLESGLHFELGPYVGILMSAKYTGTQTTSVTGQADVEHEVSVSSKDGLASTDIGVALGLGYNLESGLGFAARYGMGLTDVYDPSGPDAHKNTVIGVSVSYMFGGE